MKKRGGYFICNGRIKDHQDKSAHLLLAEEPSIFAILDYETEIGG